MALEKRSDGDIRPILSCICADEHFERKITELELRIVVTQHDRDGKL